MKLNLEFEVEQEGVDMCKELERRYLEKEITGAIRVMQKQGANIDVLFDGSSQHMWNIRR